MAGVESRGFLLGGAVAVELRVGFVAIRKGGALFPGPKLVTTADHDYRGRRHELAVQRAARGPHDRVMLVDDWAETGHQLLTAQTLIESCGASPAGVSLVVDQLTEPARRLLGPVASLVRFADLPTIPT